MGLRPYLLWFIHLHLDFRVPEFESLCATFGIEYELGAMERDSPFMVVQLPSDEAALQIGGRAILIKGIYELWGDAKDYVTIEEEINQYLNKHKENINKTFQSGWSFKMKVDGFGRKYTAEQQKVMMLKFSFMDMLQVGKVNLSKPDHTFWVIEEIGENKSQDALPKRVMFTRQVSLGNRSLIDHFNVKKRDYIGTTSMDSALSLIIANMAKATPGDYIIDPFAGTGSLIVTCSYFGAVTIGGDVDPRVLRGKGSKNVYSNFQQYKLMDKCSGLIINDNSNLRSWRSGELFDAIVGDPPYGVRAGAKKIGKRKKKNKKAPAPVGPFQNPHVPQCIPYAMEDVLIDLVVFAARTLLVGGRLVYWLPTTDEYKDSDVPLHPCFTLLANSEQVLSGHFRRRLITMEKYIAYDETIHEIDMADYNNSHIHNERPAHSNFAMKYTGDANRDEARQRTF